MLGRVECEPCDGYGQVEVETLEGDWVETYCKACGGLGGFEVYGPSTREEADRRAASEAALQAFVDSVAKHVCTHCDRSGFVAVPKLPMPCHSCEDGIVVPLRDLQAAARGALPWRRRGDEVVAIEPPDPRQGDLFRGSHE